MFVQEAVATTGQGFDPDQWLWKEIDENSIQGCRQVAVGNRHPRVPDASARSTPIDTTSLGPGWVVGATYKVDGRPITLVNVHIELFPGRRYATTTLEKTMAPLEEQLRSRHVIFGGDLNVDRLLDDPRVRDAEGVLQGGRPSGATWSEACLLHPAMNPQSSLPASPNPETHPSS